MATCSPNARAGPPSCNLAKSRGCRGMSRGTKTSPAAGDGQPELPIAPGLKRGTARVRATEVAARLAVARRAKPSPIPGYVRLLLTLEVRRELAEKLSLRAI